MTHRQKKQLYAPLDIILEAVRDHYKLENSKEIFTRTRKRHVVEKRQYFFRLCLDFTNISQENIGAYCKFKFNIKEFDHATVLHANKVIQNLCETNVKHSDNLFFLSNIIEDLKGDSDWNTQGRRKFEKLYWGNAYFKTKNMDYA